MSAVPVESTASEQSGRLSEWHGVSRDRKVLGKRLLACLFGGFVLALMIGPQEGTLTDFGVAFRQAVLHPRIFLFLGIGIVIFLALTLWPLIVPSLTRPGMVPLGAGLLVVLIAQTVMNWYDPLAESSGSGKFQALSQAVSKTPGLSSLTTAFFGWLAWALLAAAVVSCVAGIIARISLLGYVTAVIGVAGAVIAYLSHHNVVSLTHGLDHSLGVYADVIGFLILAGAGLTVALAHSETADPRGFVRTALEFRPGLVLAAVGLILGIFAYTTDGWFGTTSQINATISQTAVLFKGTGLSSLATTYLSWLGYLLFGIGAAVTLAATYLRHYLLGWAGIVVSIVAIVLTFLTIDKLSGLGAARASQYGETWQNLGVGGWMALLAFALFLAADIAVANRNPVRRPIEADPAVPSEAPDPDEEPLLAGRQRGRRFTVRDLPMHRVVEQTRRSRNTRALLVAGLGVALFYPPTLPVTWQNVLVGQIGIYLLLAIGLNVVVGWAGLLDLGYIAFYEIGCYTTAYLTGSLPVKPPSWLHMTPLLTIPFAIIACLIAGVLLGAPTLRLRGDYLAIVTLGFGEIIQIVAINWKSFTGGPIGPNIPHPVLDVGFSVTWGEDNLPYWYLLLVMLIIVLVLFYRLESSRIGRAWAAIREDEVAAQASGVNVTRIKLLAFAIGASTSGLAGTFFASQVGYFDPTLFTLQASILIVAYVVFGGMGSLPGAMAGAFVLTWLPQFLKDQVPQDDRQMWIGALVLAMMIFRPAGLLPARRRKAELEGHLGGADSAETTAVSRSGAL